MQLHLNEPRKIIFLGGLQCFLGRDGDVLLLTTACYHPQMLQIFQRATPSNKRRKLNTKNIKSAAVLKLANMVSESRAQQR